MSLSLAELTRIAEAVGREQTPALTIVGVASSDSDSERVELLITVAGCHNEPCTLLLNLSRHERTQFEAELRSELRRTLRTHQSAGRE
jgi:hypothetical protein